MSSKFEAYILLTIDPANIKKTSQYLLGLDKVENIHELYGPYDIIIKAVATNAADLDDFCEDKIRHFSGVKATETLTVSETVKESTTATTGTNEAEVFMLVNTKFGRKRKVAKSLAKFKQVESVHELYGQFDIILKIKEADMRGLEDFIQKNIRTMGGVEGTETLVVADVP